MYTIAAFFIGLIIGVMAMGWLAAAKDGVDINKAKKIGKIEGKLEAIRKLEEAKNEM